MSVQGPGPLASLMVAAAESLVSAMPVDAIYMCLPDPGGRSASLHCLYDSRDRIEAPARSFTLAGTIVADMLGAGSARILSRPFADAFGALEMSLSRAIGSVLIVPLEGSRGSVGTLVLGSRTEHAFDEGHARAVVPIVAPLARAVEDGIAGVV
jgi:hypothetical protein